MNARRRLSALVSTSGRETVHDEEILNVLRQNDDIAMGTTAISEEVGLTGEGVKNRLRQLESEDRVKSQEIGRTLIWDLESGERDQIVPPEIDRLVHAFDRVRGIFEFHSRVGVYFILAGFALIFAALTAAVTTAPPAIEGISGQSLALGYAVTAAGGVMWVIGGGMQLGTVVTERLLYRELTGQRFGTTGEPEAQSTEQRGQLDPRILVGLFVLVLVAGPLLTAAIEMGTGLAAVDGVSPLYAVLFTVCVFAVIVMAILGLD